MHGRIGILCLALFAGCTELPEPSPIERGGQDNGLAASFDPAATGTIEGRVVWDGGVPEAKESVVRVIAYNPGLFQKPGRFTTPHVPVVHPKNGGVANAVVYLKVIDPRRSKPWDHPKASVQFHDRNLTIQQGPTRTSVGFVQRGGAVEIINRDVEYHNLRARGAAFFAMPLIESNRSHERVLSRAGLVDLTCGAGYYWLHAHLFVVEHPYYVRTDGEGRFVLDRVPAGNYQIVCWLPNWRVERSERDPETADVARWIWAAPVEQMQNVRVESGRVSEITYRCDQARFGAD